MRQRSGRGGRRLTARDRPDCSPTETAACAPTGIMDLTYKIVRRLLRDDDVDFSRNKNFEAYADPTVERAVRIYHHLESIERDLLALGPGGDALLERVDRDDDRVVLKLTFADGDARRVSYLTRKDWKLLLEDHRVSEQLESLAEEADPETREFLRRMLDESDSFSPS